jgi:hypothetical protein
MNDIRLSTAKLPGKDCPVKTQRNPFFIVGTQRSGTTLLRLILNSHSQIAVPEESVFLMPLLRKHYLRQPLRRPQLEMVADYLLSSDHFRLWNYDHASFISKLREVEQMSLHDLIFNLFDSYCSSQGKLTWGDKTPSFFRKIDILQTLFPRAKYIHIVRDGRDVFDSWRKLDPTKSNVAVAALDWSYKLFKIERSLESLADDNKLSLRYEDLLVEPEATVRSVTDFLGMEYEENMLDFYRTSHKYVGDHHSKLIFRPLDKGNRTKWKRNLKPREIRVFELLGRHYLTKYKYELSGGAVAGGDILFAINALSIGLPLRLLQVLRIALIVEKGLRGGKQMGALTVGQMPSEPGTTHGVSARSELVAEPNSTCERRGHTH